MLRAENVTCMFVRLASCRQFLAISMASHISSHTSAIINIVHCKSVAKLVQTVFQTRKYTLNTCVFPHIHS